MENKKMSRIIALLCGLAGITLLLIVFVPIGLYNFFSVPVATFLSPVPYKLVDYTKASNWFPGAPNNNSFSSSQISFYTLSIPKVLIKDATVSIGGEDLGKSLIQYPGTAVPGRPGNSVIFGHSILPIFYNPKNYLSVFSKLPILEKGDQIAVNYDGVLYQYRVEDKFEVLPEDIQILEQNMSDSFLTLVTCVPPGDPRKPRRLVVRARVIPPSLGFEKNK